MTKENALRRLEYRTETLARLVLLGAPEIILENQRQLVAIAEGWVSSPPPDIPDYPPQ